ncbi:MAG: hypothetical protein PSV36_19065 [Algoriphagus sp.]|nr:hypothetical protein [Algoriphagus sp.]
MNQNHIHSFIVARKALKKIYPSWQLFIDELMDKLEPFWLGHQSQEEVHFIQLIGYGNRNKTKQILTDILELMDWQSESVFLWNNWDNSRPSPFSQVLGFQEAYRIFPKVVITDFFSEFFAEAYSDYEKCIEFNCVEDFLRGRKELDYSFFECPPTDARGGLVISYLNSFVSSDFVGTRVIFQFLWENPVESFEELRKRFVPEAMEKMIGKGYVRRDELVFFSKDEPHYILLAFELLMVSQMIEIRGSELIGKPVKLTFNAIDYFLEYVFFKKLSFPQLHRAAWDFFLPIFRHFPRMTQKFDLKSEQVELDFTGGWKFNVTAE